VLLFGMLAAGSLIAAAWRQLTGSSPKRPHEPLDIATLASSLLGLDRGRGFAPADPVRAITPRGLVVLVTCAHCGGHRSPELGVRVPGPAEDQDRALRR
jgi:hypothetical protein